MASVLNNQGGYYSAAVYIQESKRMGLQIFLPDINISEYEYFGKENSLYIGFLAIKNFSKSLSKQISKEREKNGRYVSLIDFLVRTEPNVKETELLIKIGGMTSLNVTRPTLMRLLDVYLLQRKIFDQEKQDLFAFESYRLEQNIKTEFGYPVSKICKIEYESLGYMVTRHPLEFFSSVVNRTDIVKASEMINYNGRGIKMVGWFMASKRIKTKNGEFMKFLSLEDLTGTFEAVIFPNVYKYFASKTISMGPYLVEGEADIENGYNLIVRSLLVLSAKELVATTQKDVSDKKYYGEKESISEEEFEIVSSLGKVNLQLAYAS
jgi:DNA polymerase III alpha subunit